jgi:sulfur carrier protein
LYNATSNFGGQSSRRKIAKIRFANAPIIFVKWCFKLAYLIPRMQLTINGKTRDFAVTQLTVAELVVQLNLEGKRLAIERNGEIVPRSQFAITPLMTGDQLEIVGAVGGG